MLNADDQIFVVSKTNIYSEPSTVTATVNASTGTRYHQIHNMPRSLPSAARDMEVYLFLNNGALLFGTHDGMG